MVLPPRGSGMRTTLIPGQYRVSWMPQGDLGIQDRGSGVSVAATLPCTP